MKEQIQKQLEILENCVDNLRSLIKDEHLEELEEYVSCYIGYVKTRYCDTPASNYLKEYLNDVVKHGDAFYKNGNIVMEVINNKYNGKLLYVDGKVWTDFKNEWYLSSDDVGWIIKTVIKECFEYDVNCVMNKAGLYKKWKNKKSI